MKILITGGAGFIGSAVVRLAISRGHTVINVDNLTYAANLKNLAICENNPKYTFEKANILDLNHLQYIFSKHNPDLVMHLAAETHVDRSIDKPINFVQTNIVGTVNFLDAALDFWQKNGCPKSFRFHHISTDEVFGSLSNDANLKFNEQTSYNPRNPYSASKASSDHFVRAWHETYGLPILITNCSNNYGPYHFPEKFIPLIIIKALSEEKLPIFGEGKNIRDWLYVEDHADALLHVLEKGKIGRGYNIGGENELTNFDLVNTLCKILDGLHPRKEGIYSDLIIFVEDRPGHDFRYAMDTNRIRNELGWFPSTEINKGLEKTVRWYINNKNWWQPLIKMKGTSERLGLKV